jgi:hypothetical protein
MSLAKNNTLVITNATAEGKPELTPKPKFLENLDKFLHRELKKLGATNSTIANEARLQVSYTNNKFQLSVDNFD